MRVLVADSDSEALEAIGRAFEVDVAASKVTCIDLLRANEYDVLVAAERLEDGSGLELLSQVAKRWPEVVRILAIEPARRAMLRGKLAPFKLFDTIPYPIDEAHLEGALQHAADFCETEEPRARLPLSSRVAVSRPDHAPMTGRLDRDGSGPARSADAGASAGLSARLNAYRARAASSGAAQPARQREPANADSPPPLPTFASMRDYVPLGAPEQGQVRIVQHDYDSSQDPLSARVQRSEEKAAPTLPSKAAALAAAVSAAVTRYIKPEPEPEPEPDPPFRRRKR